MDIIEKLPTIKRLMRHLQQVPFLASKNTYKVMSYFLKLDKERIDQLCLVLQDIKKNVKLCSLCLVWHEKDMGCLFCGDTSRDQTVICVVESWQELLIIERTEGYRGLYHVLGGVISPLDGIGPSDLSIDQLVKRAVGEVKEIILAMSQTPEGEATMAFIARRLKEHSVSVSCLARGVPVGSTLEFIDRLTLSKALADRKPF
ncbi:recombination protein RecR [Candidatus Dependentiae bacterium]|nr:recombination protein RecR [Candidatus Dependentiae bacterium]